MRVEGVYRTPVLGVSTLSDRNKMKGHAIAQVNFRSDPINKLTRRKPLIWQNVLDNVIEEENLVTHRYKYLGKSFRLIIDKAALGYVRFYVDGVEKQLAEGVAESLVHTMGDNPKFRTIAGKTYVINPDVTVEMYSDPLEVTAWNASHINILTALNYGESIQVTVDGQVATYTVPDLGITDPDYDTADKARATTAVAQGLASAITALSTVSVAYTKGSSIAILSASGFNVWPKVTIEAGQGSRSAVAFNEVVSSPSGLPLYAIAGTRVKVQPDPSSSSGVYYLEATTVTQITELVGGLEPKYYNEVAWTESRALDIDHYFGDDRSFGTTGTPSILEYNGVTEELEIDLEAFTERERGDNTSVPAPAFVGKSIRDVTEFQNRLVILTDDAVSMSQTDDHKNFFKQSAIQLLVTDPVGIKSTAEVDSLEHFVQQGKSLLVITSNGQFKFDGTVAVTPETVTLPLTTTYDCDIDARPTSMGNSTYLPIKYNGNGGLLEFTAEKNSPQDVGKQITQHVVGLMEGCIVKVVSNSNAQIIIAWTGIPNILYVYEQEVNRKGTLIQSAWSTWELPETTNIKDVDIQDSEVLLLSYENGAIVEKTVSLYKTVTENVIYLDDKLVLQTDGLTVTVPTDYVTDGKKLIQSTGTVMPLFDMGFTRSGDILTFTEDIGTGEVEIGSVYTSSYMPNRPFEYTDEGIAVTSNKLRVSHFTVAVENTSQLNFDIISDFYSTATQVHTAWTIGSTAMVLGEQPMYTGDCRFSYAQDVSLAQARLSCSNHLNCTISGIKWEGQYHKSKRRM